MAQRTIAPGGGNINVAATYVELAVPGASDFIVGNSTSGQLTVNSTITIQRMDLSAYTNTLTMTSGGINLTQNTVTTTFGAGMTFSGNPSTGGFINFQATNHTITQNTMSEIPRARFNGSFILTTNLQIKNLDLQAQSFRSDNFTMNISGDMVYASAFSTGLGIFGSTNYLLTSLSGRLGATFGPGPTTRTVTITGNYETRNTGLELLDFTTVIYTAGTAGVNFNIVIRRDGNNTNTLNVNQPNAKLWLLSRPTGTGTSSNIINLTGPLVVDYIGSENESYSYTNGNNYFNYRFSGNSITTNVLSLSPSFQMNSATAAFPATVNLSTYRAVTITLDRLFTHTIGRLELSGGGLAYPVAGFAPINPLIKSDSPGNQVSINLLDKTQSQIINYDFTDVNAVGDEIIAIRGTITNSLNVTNVYPTGGGGGGESSYVFFS